MKRIGLTGNIGTGKSTVAQIFEVLGIPVYHADHQAKLILDSEIVREQIATIFGAEVLTSNQRVDRKALAAIVFNNSAKLDSLNNLVHPLVKKDFSDWCETHSAKDYILHEAAILFESGFDRLFNKNILVIAPEELCVSRVIARDGITEQLVKDRMRNQWQQEKKEKLADYTIRNDEKSLVIPQVLEIHRNILETI